MESDPSHSPQGNLRQGAGCREGVCLGGQETVLQRDLKIDSSSFCRQLFAVSRELSWASPAAPLSHQTSPVPICPIGFVTFSPTRLTVSVTTWTRAHVSHRLLPFLMVHSSV